MARRWLWGVPWFRGLPVRAAPGDTPTAEVGLGGMRVAGTSRFPPSVSAVSGWRPGTTAPSARAGRTRKRTCIPVFFCGFLCYNTIQLPGDQGMDLRDALI